MATTQTVTSAITTTMASAAATSTLRAAPQGGILEGSNPAHYDPGHPLILFIIQVTPPPPLPSQQHGSDKRTRQAS